MLKAFSCFLPGVAFLFATRVPRAENDGLWRCTIPPVSNARSMLDVLRKSLKDSDLPFRDFVELVLFHPDFGYYARTESPVGREGDYVTSPVLSPVFAYSLGNLCREFMSRTGDGVSQFVDIGRGDGGL